MSTSLQEALEDLTRRVRAALPSAPARFAPDPAASLLATRRLRLAMPRHAALPPTFEQWRALAEGLSLGDPPADALAASLARDRGGPGWQQVEQGMARGLDAVSAPSPELVRFLEAVETPPSWLDRERLRLGAQVCALGSEAAMASLLVSGLAGGYQLSAINRTLIATGQLQESPAQRLGYTTRWFLDITEEDHLERTSPGFRSTLRVRLIHALVRQRLLSAGWDEAALGLPINQTDMQATYLGFGPVYLLGMQLMGVTTTPEERAAYLHRLRYVAWLLGMEEARLHALEDEEGAALALLHRNLLQQPMADETSAQLARPLILEEPLQRRYPAAPWLWGHFTRAKGLSIASASLGPAGLRALGLPAAQLPWYPLARHAYNQVLHRAARAVPGGRDWLVRRGRQSQRDVLEQVGAAGPDLRHGAGPR